MSDPEVQNEALFFHPDTLMSLQEDLKLLTPQWAELIDAFESLELNNPQSREYVFHGFLRRLSTLKRCIENVFEIHPPQKIENPSKNNLEDLKINLQAFMFNCYGCIDNLAWVWVKETYFNYQSRKNIYFFYNKIKQQLSPDFATCLENLSPWFKYLEDFRHALAHRIPLFIPPFTINSEDEELYKQIELEIYAAIGKGDFAEYTKLLEEQHTLGKFLPLMTHSFSESSKSLIFHAQLIVDWKTMRHLAYAFLKELKYQEAKRKS
jgi:hypothetical protein